MKTLSDAVALTLGAFLVSSGLRDVVRAMFDGQRRRRRAQEIRKVQNCPICPLCQLQALPGALSLTKEAGEGSLSFPVGGELSRPRRRAQRRGSR